MSSAVILPGSVDEVSKIVKIANTYKMPIHAISIGRNLGYGGASPRLRGAAVLLLSRMDRILQVDEESATVLVEPGVSYFNLYEHLQSTGSNLWIDCPGPYFNLHEHLQSTEYNASMSDIGWGSVLGNAVERGAGYTPYGDHFMFQ